MGRRARILVSEQGLEEGRSGDVGSGRWPTGPTPGADGPRPLDRVRGRRVMPKKRRRGHYCWVCRRVLPNERFSGRGHRDHVCKPCRTELRRARRAERERAVGSPGKGDVNDGSGGNHRELKEPAEGLG